MNFKTYQILALIIPGFLALITIFVLFNINYQKDYALAYIVIAFFLGFLLDTISSWLEGLYFFTWRGKPSDRLLEGRDIWKVRFYHSDEIKSLLKRKTSSVKPSNDELFSIAMRYANGEKNSRVDDFNSFYSFSRVLLTTSILGGVPLLFLNYNNWKFYSIIIPLIIILWLKCKQNGYYYAREVLNVFLKLEKFDATN